MLKKLTLSYMIEFKQKMPYSKYYKSAIIMIN